MLIHHWRRQQAFSPLLLVRLCLWTVTFTNISPFFSLSPLCGTGWLEWARGYVHLVPLLVGPSTNLNSHILFKYLIPIRQLKLFAFHIFQCFSFSFVKKLKGFKCNYRLFSIYVMCMLTPSCFSPFLSHKTFETFMSHDFIDISCFMCSFHQASKGESEAQRGWPWPCCFSLSFHPSPLTTNPEKCENRAKRKQRSILSTRYTLNLLKLYSIVRAGW